MTCGHCVSAVREALYALPGVNVHRVGIGSASITLEPAGASPSALVEAIREAGYQASFAQPGFAERANSPANRELRQAPGGSGCCSTR
jgi:copper chaperone